MPGDDRGTAMKVGQAAGTYFQRGDHRHRVVIGKDTRLSGYMLENAMTAGFTSVGMDVVLLGPLPTPAVAMLTRSMRADVGVMISASHNPFEDNGIKLFGPDGFKLSDEANWRSRRLLERSWAWHRPATSAAPAASRMRAAAISTRSRPRCRTTCASTACASWSIAPMARPIPWPSALWELGAEVIAIGVERQEHQPGRRLHPPGAIKAKVREVRADIGIALDGDADRLIVVDEKGQTVDGDQIMALIGSQLAARGALLAAAWWPR
jgi:phosphoglucosamine mutase